MRAAGGRLGVAGTTSAASWHGKGPYWQPPLGERLAGPDLSLDTDGLTIGGRRELYDKERSNWNGGCEVRPGFDSQQQRSGASLEQCRYGVAPRVSTRMGEEVRVEGAILTGGQPFLFPSLEVIREGHSLPLILDNRALLAGECAKDSLQQKPPISQLRIQRRLLRRGLATLRRGRALPLQLASGISRRKSRVFRPRAPSMEKNGPVGN